jgi:hypothetical protein
VNTYTIKVYHRVGQQWNEHWGSVLASSIFVDIQDGRISGVVTSMVENDVVVC